MQIDRFTSRFMTAWVTILLLTVSVSLVLTPVTLHAQGASVSGVVEMNYKYIEENADNPNTTSEARIEDVMLYIKGPVGDKANFFSEFMIHPQSADDEVGSAHDQSITVERMYLSSSKLISGLNIKAGLFQVFDGTIKDYHVATSNPLPGDIIFFNSPFVGHHGNGTLHDVFTDIGVSVSGMKGPFGFTAGVFNGLGERTPKRSAFDDAEPSGAWLKLLYTSRSIQGLQAGLGYYNATGTEMEVLGHGGTPTGALFEPEDEYLIPELIYRWHPWTFTALYLSGTQTRAVTHEEHHELGLAYGERDHEGDGYMVEAIYGATHKLDLVGRYQTVSADDNTMNFFGAGTTFGHSGAESIGDLEQTEIGLNYSWSPRITFKASWQINDEDGVDVAGDRGLFQIAASF